MTRGARGNPCLSDYEAWMRAALREADKAASSGEVPVGAVVVGPSGEILSRAHNRPVGACDPCAHAEIIALRRAARRTANYRLSGCRLVATLEPCAMCAGAAVHARIEEIVFGADDPKSGAVRSLFRIPTDRRLNHRARVKRGVLADLCAERLRSFFAERRPKGRGPVRAGEGSGKGSSG